MVWVWLLLLGTAAHAAADIEAVDVEVFASQSRPFKHKWKRSFGSGHAALTLRKDWRDHLKLAADELGMSGVRYHGIFDDDNGPVVALAPNGSHVYNFTLIDSTWDYLLAHGVKPVVELSFMPAVLANCSWHGHCPENHINCTGYWCTQCNGKGVLDPPFNAQAPPCHALEFHYQGIKQMPYNNDYSGWYDLVKATAEHAVARYGLAEVQSWSFEVWNELWGMRWPTDYMALYNSSAHAIKAVHPSLIVGGPATAGLDKITDFVDRCKNASIPYDFVSSHHYPTDGKNGEGPPACPRGAAWDPTCFSTQVKTSRQLVASDKFYLTEYNVGCCLGMEQHDVSDAAAFIFRAVAELNDDLELYSYWTFTDVFEEGGLPLIEFKNIYGIMTINGVPKPAWRAFQLLHSHAGDQRLDTMVRPAASATTTADTGTDADTDTDTPCTNCQGKSAGYCKDDTAVCYPYSSPGVCPPGTKKCTPGPGPSPTPPPPPPTNSSAELISAFSTANASTGAVSVFVSFWGNPDASQPPPADRIVTVYLHHSAPDPAPTTVTLHIINSSSTNPRAAWEAMGQPAVPDSQQMAALLAASQFITETASVKQINATTTAVTLKASVNTAMVVAFF